MTFKAVFPEFSAETNVRISLLGGIASESVSDSAWGSLAEAGMLYLTAHLLARGNAMAASGGGASGPVTQSKVGDLSRTYGQIMGLTGEEGLYSTTGYGIEYLRLRSQIVQGPLLTC